MSDDLGPLAAALAKAQMAFPPIVRDKHVTVTSKTGASYSFDYAPLESVIDATRAPLAQNGLALVQVLDEDSLVTRLIHESGASLTGRMDLPQTTGMQEMGSAITYLRRYAIQSMLGIAAEDDDDGNRAVGGSITPRGRADRAASRTDADGSLIGTVTVADKAAQDFSLRQAPDGHALGFRLKGDRGSILVRCADPLASQLAPHRDAVVGALVTCWGTVSEESFTPKGGDRVVAYQVLTAERVRVPGLGDLPAGDAAQPQDRTEQEELDALAW